MKMISPSRVFIVVLMMFASMGRTADAQGLQGIFDFFESFDFQSLFDSICPFLSPFLGSLNISVCDDSGGDDDTGTDDSAPTAPVKSPVAAPTKKGKVVASTSSPVAPPSETP
jgi:hypothetical protein